jgi:hypothetical protein
MKSTKFRTFSCSLLILLCCCGGAVMLTPIASAGRPSTLGWFQVSPTDSPPARSYLAMAYDPASGKIIMFGGFDGNGYLNDTWAFDGITWTQIATNTPPPARAAAQMAYDSVTQKVVLYGGFDGANYLGDTWIWNGTTLQWTQATPAHHPPAVTGPMLFQDPNGRVDYFGGFNGQFYQLTMWQWNGSDWTQLFPPTVPFARASAAVATNTTTGQVVMFGGLADVNPINTWTYDGTTWTLQSPRAQPPWVYAGSAVFDPILNTVVLFGGGNGGVDQDNTWRWYGSVSNWRPLFRSLRPEAREGAGMAYDSLLRHVVLFGGQDNEEPLNDTWEL